MNTFTEIAQRTRGIARFEVDHPPEQHRDDQVELLAGVAEVDITPPPGLPKAGYSANANDGRGFRSRLRARVFHLRRGTESIAIVQCDLLGGSSVVQHLVADRIADSTDVPLRGLMIGATHTHAGPGQFLGTAFYNRFASNRAGFDPDWTGFLVDQISAGVESAVANRAPAVVGTGSIDVWGLTRNRSLVPHVSNETVLDSRSEPQRAYVNINPDLHMIRIDRLHDDRSTSPLGAAMVFSVHGTGISMKSHDYNADLWAYVVDECVYRIDRKTGVRPIVGAMEGTHADVAPALRPSMAGHTEAERVGRAIGNRAAELFGRLGDSLTSEVALGAKFREIDVEREHDSGVVQIPRRPAVGAALVAGAHENLTPVISKIPPFRPGLANPFSGADSDHGAKWVLGSKWLQPAILPLDQFPRFIPQQILQIGDVCVVGLPFEITVEAGRRLAQAVGEACGADERNIWVTSVANEYFGYVTTAEEYQHQYYEGGHTLFGPRQLAFLASKIRELAGESDEEAALRASQNYARSWVLAMRRFIAAPSAQRPRRLATATPVFIAATATDDPCWEMSYRDSPVGDLIWHEPLIAVEQSIDGGDTWEPVVRRGVALTDASVDIEVLHTGDDAIGSTYVVRWHRPDFGQNLCHRFVLVANGGQSLWEGPAFS